MGTLRGGLVSEGFVLTFKLEYLSFPIKVPLK